MDLDRIFTECNNHLRDSDRKRDQLVYFYILITGTFLAAIININAGLAQSIIPPFGLSLLIFGLILARTLTEYRKWHVRYINTVQLLLVLKANKRQKKSTTVANERKFAHLELGIDKSTGFLPIKWLQRYFVGVEFLTYNAFLLFTFLPLYLLLNYFQMSSLVPIADVLLYTTSIVVYWLIMNLWSARILYKGFVISPWANWLLKGIVD